MTTFVYPVAEGETLADAEAFQIAEDELSKCFGASALVGDEFRAWDKKFGYVASLIEVKRCDDLGTPYAIDTAADILFPTTYSHQMGRWMSLAAREPIWQRIQDSAENYMKSVRLPTWYRRWLQLQFLAWGIEQATGAPFHTEDVNQGGLIEIGAREFEFSFAWQPGEPHAAAMTRFAEEIKVAQARLREMGPPKGTTIGAAARQRIQRDVRNCGR